MNSSLIHAPISRKERATTAHSRTTKRGAPPGGWTNEVIAERAALYTTRYAFQKGLDGPAYQAALRRDILGQVCGHMKQLRRELTKKLCAKVAAKHRTRTSFAKADPPAYNKSRTEEWLEEICVDMDPVPVEWTQEAILEAARSCNSLEEFKYNCRGAANAARTLGIWSLVVEILGYQRVPWGPERVFWEASKYNTVSEFQDACPAGYAAGAALGILDQACAHMAPSPVVHSDDELRAAISRYVSPSEFAHLEPDLYRKAQERGLLDAAFEEGSFDPTEIFAAAEQCNSVGEFYNRFRPEYRCAKLGGYLGDILADLGPSYEELKAIASTCQGRLELRDRYLPIYRNAAARGLLGDLFEGREVWERWEKDEVVGIARRYGSPVAFAMAEPQAYAAAHYNGWAHEAQAHMDRFYQDWSLVSVRAEIAASVSRSAFQRRAPGAYAWARREGLLGVLTAHFPKDHWLDPETPTSVYIHQCGRRIYVGISIDPEYRKKIHRTASDRVVATTVRNGAMHVFSRETTADGPRPYIMPRYVARRLERRLIRRFAAQGFEVTNKAHNPQYSRMTRRYDWTR